MSIRAVVVDIDGTMTDYSRRLDLDGVRAIRAVEAKGIPVLAATGNVAPMARAFASFVGTTGPVVCENGGIVYDASFRRKKVLASRAHADRAARFLRRSGFDVRYIPSDPWRETEVALELNLDGDAVRRVLQGWKLTVVSSRFALHLMDPRLDKIHGLRAALPFLERAARPAEMLAIGDSNNDLGLLRGCRYAGAPANATDQVRSVAGFVATKKHGAGVKQVLEHYGVI